MNTNKIEVEISEEERYIIVKFLSVFSGQMFYYQGRLHFRLYPVHEECENGEYKTYNAFDYVSNKFVYIAENTEVDICRSKEESNIIQAFNMELSSDEEYNRLKNMTLEEYEEYKKSENKKEK